jgi:hypothetical protein
MDAIDRIIGISAADAFYLLSFVLCQNRNPDMPWHVSKMIDNSNNQVMGMAGRPRNISRRSLARSQPATQSARRGK